MVSVRARLAFGMGVLGLAAACTAPPSELERVRRSEDAIINGAIDPAHSAAVAYLHNAGKCTATIIAVKGSTGYALTAGHCVGSGGKLYQAQNYSLPGAVIYNVTSAVTHPGYPASKLYDFAVLTFSGATVNTPALPVAKSNDGVSAGSTVDMIGYGQTQDNAGETTSRYHKIMKVKSATDLRLTYDQKNGGLCHGDSGGPSMFGPAPETVVGVHSYVSAENGSCLVEGTDVRVSAVVDTFINPVINGTAIQPQNCGQCQEAHTVSGSCTAKVKSFYADPNANAYQSCVNSCATSACQIDCKNKYPNAAALYDAIFTCVCTSACPKECAQASFCNKPKCGLTSSKSGCQSCFEASCCAEAKACANSSTCVTCITQLVPGPNCKTDPTTVAYNQCLSSSCSMQCGSSSSSSSSSSTATTSVTTGVGAGGAGTTSAEASSGAGAEDGAGEQGKGQVIYEVTSCAFRARHGANQKTISSDPADDRLIAWLTLAAGSAAIMRLRRRHRRVR